MKRKKRQIYCETCEMPANWYKRGKKRVLVCDRCGIIAHNPRPKIKKDFVMFKGARRVLSGEDPLTATIGAVKDSVSDIGDNVKLIKSRGKTPIKENSTKPFDLMSKEERAVYEVLNWGKSKR